MEGVYEFHERGIINKGNKATFIVLTPKKDGVEQLSDYRPISFVGSLYKIISKILASRLREFLGLLVSKNQCVFVKGRQISDGILIVNECVEERLKSGKKGVI